MAEATDSIDKKEQNVQALSQALESGTINNAKIMLNALHPTEIAHLLESLPPRQCDLAWKLVLKDQQAEVLINLGEDTRNLLVKDMSPQELVSVAQELDVDDSADFVQSLPDAVINTVLHSLNQQHREMLESVLSYPEDSAGGLMNTDTITVRPEVTLDVVLRYMRLLGEIPDLTDSLIVVNRRNHYIGTLPLSELLINDPQATVADVMDTEVEAIASDMSDTEVAKLFEAYDLISAPVVDAHGVLLGRITIDDVVDVIREEADHSVLSMAGLTDEEDLFSPVMRSSMRRAIWLGINLITAFMASWVVSNFETTLEKVVTVAVLMNVVASMGGIAGSQTITLMIRGIALGQVSRSNRNWIFNKEVLVSLINGSLWALVVAGIAIAWFGDVSIGVVIAAALLINLFFAAASGVIIPLILRKFGIDPAIAGSVILTTVTDIVGLFAFLGLATLFLL
ncbi:MAG: magnesium transporter [Gammaproteobacteria bacterium]|nr:MAG: magnesium transporter [Gammaproteobacteria bacterium]